MICAIALRMPSKYWPTNDETDAAPVVEPPAEKPKQAKNHDSNGAAYKRFLARQIKREQSLNRVSQREQLIQRVSARLDALTHYLEDDETWFKKMEESRLKDLVAAEQDYIQILQTLTGHATTIIGVQHQQKLDQVLPELLRVMQQRGLAPPVVALPPPSEPPTC